MKSEPFWRMMVSPFLARAKIRPKLRFASEIMIVFMGLKQDPSGLASSGACGD